MNFQTALSKDLPQHGHPSAEQEKPVLGVLKIGANITFASSANRTAANFDIISMSRALAPNFHLHFIAKRTRNTTIPKESSFTDIIEAMNCVNDLGLDALLVFNGSLNAFGGVEPFESIAIWKIINTFKGRVFYVHTDGQMRLHQIWEGFEKRGWDAHWKKEEILIVRDDIVYLTQAKDLTRVNQLTSTKNAVPIKTENIAYFPIQEAILLRPPKFTRPREITWDLIYGGSFRSGNRRERMLKWYFGHGDPQLKVLMFGNVNVERFGSFGVWPIPEFEGPVPNAEFTYKMRTGLATVQIVDNWYENQWITLRFYEALVAGVVPFIDFIADRKKQLYFPGSALADFLYVTKRKELADRIELIKKEDCLDEVIDLCRDSVRMHWNKDAYFDELKQTIMRYM